MIQKLILMGWLFFSLPIFSQVDSIQWKGSYVYTEEPIKILAGYNAVMIWELSLVDSLSEISGTLEVNGRMTWAKYEVKGINTTDTLHLKYSKLIEGSPIYNSSSDSTFFHLHSLNGQIITTWIGAEPRLTPLKESHCYCFYRED
jgi:hypothetical protein